MLNARGGCMCIVLGLGGGGDEINDPVDSSYSVKSFIDACTGIFSGSCHTSDFKTGTPVSTLPGAWHYRVSAVTGLPVVSIL